MQIRSEIRSRNSVSCPSSSFLTLVELQRSANDSDTQPQMSGNGFTRMQRWRQSGRKPKHNITCSLSSAADAASTISAQLSGPVLRSMECAATLRGLRARHINSIHRRSGAQRTLFARELKLYYSTRDHLLDSVVDLSQGGSASHTSHRTEVCFCQQVSS